MTEKYILAHDMGTGSNKSILVSIHGDIIDSCRQAYSLYYPKPGYAEHEPDELWNAICQNTHTLLKTSGIAPTQIVGVTFSSLMQCLIAVDKAGNHLTPNITWLDGRSADIIRKVLWTAPRIQGYNIFKLLRFLRITGGTPGHTGKDQIGKLLWLQQYQPDVFKKTYKFLDAKDFIIFRMTGKMVTSVDLAVIWWLLDTRGHRNCWHPGLCRLAGISLDQLPEVRESAAVVGNITPAAADRLGLVAGTPVINGAGDLSAAALGSGAILDGELHIALGTSNWVAGHYTRRKIDLAHYTGCIGSTYPHKYYLGMAHQETAGLCLEWFIKNLIAGESAAEDREEIAERYQLADRWVSESQPGVNGLFFLPWLYGERCPINDDLARGGFFNLSLHHTRSDLMRALFEGVSFNIRWALETLQKLYQPVDSLNIIGGGAKSDVWCQIIADITGKIIRRVENPQIAGAKGIALLASMTLGYIPSFEDIKKYIKIDKTFYPDPRNLIRYNQLFREYKKMYYQNKSWFKRVKRIFS